MLAELRRGGLLNADGAILLVGETFAYYMENAIRPNCSPRTFESYESTFRIHLHPLAKLKLAAVASRHVQSISDDLRDKGMSRTAEYVVLVLSRFYNWCIKREIAVRNPTANVTLPKVGAPGTRIMSLEDIEIVFGEAEQRFTQGRFRCYPVLVFCLNTGLRISEALALTQDDLLARNQQTCVAVDKQVLYEGERWTLRPTKCNSSRMIALNDAARNAINFSRVTIGHDAIRAKAAYTNSGFLFPNEVGDPMRPCVPYRAFTRLQKSLGMSDPFTVHELRHTFLSLLARKNPLQVVMKVAGHSSLRTTERYLKTLESDVVAATTAQLYE